MGTVYHLQEVFAQLRSTISALPPPPHSSPSLPPSDFSEDLALIEASDRLNERTLPRVQISSFKSEQDLDQQLLSRVVASIETVIRINSSDTNKDLTKVIKWVTDFELKVKESAAVVDLDARSSPHHSSSPLPSHSNDSSNFASSTTPLIDSLSPSSSAQLESTRTQQEDSGVGEEGQDQGQEGGEVAKNDEVLKVGEKHGRDEEDGEASEQSGEEKEDERTLRKRKREAVKLQEYEDSNDREESFELEMDVDSDTGIVSKEWREAHHPFIYLGTRSFELLDEAISVYNDYFKARRNHQPPLSDDSFLEYAKPYEQLYLDWHIEHHNVDRYLGEKWKNLFALAEEKDVASEELLTSLRFIHGPLKDGFVPDIQTLEVYVKDGFGKHAQQAAARRRQAKQPTFAPSYVEKKPNVTSVKLVATALKLFHTTRSIPVTIGSGTAANFLSVQHSSKLFGSRIAFCFTFTDRFDKDETAKAQLLYNAIKAVKKTKPHRKKSAARRPKAAGSVTGWIRNSDNDFFLETEDYSISLTEPIADQIEKVIKPLFEEREGLFTRLGEVGHWYAVEQEEGWTLARYDVEVPVDSHKVFICEL